MNPIFSSNSLLADARQLINVARQRVAAAKVGDIHANNTYPADFLMSNRLIEANICRAA